MASHADRYTVISTLLQAATPLSLEELSDSCDLDVASTEGLLGSLVSEGLVVEGSLLADRPAPQYCWAVRWAEATGKGAAVSRQKLEALLEDLPKVLDIDSEAVVAFNRYLIDDYRPPGDKRLLIFFQCSVRRPFSKSPSHASMRRAVSVATGFDPAKDFESCPVHVVVLASNMGPVPYELEDVYPANVGGGGVKHFSDEQYGRVRPRLSERVSNYLTAHRKCYDHIASFTDGRYGEVMRDACELAGERFPIFPDPKGPHVVSVGDSRPRTYWAKCWIQLYFEIEKWLKPSARKQARQRLKDLDVHYED